ncbi:hypothetical protein AOLI_G00167430 [Acnodon oligacanthus]
MGKLGRRCFKPITRPAGRSPAGLPGRGRGTPLRSLARFPTKTAASVVGSLADGAQAKVKCPRRELTIMANSADFEFGDGKGLSVELEH